MPELACSRCDNARAFYRDFMRVRRKGGGVAWGSWYGCRVCGHRWDGVTVSSDGVLPADVVARLAQLEPEEETG